MPTRVLSGSMEATFIMLPGCLIQMPLWAAAMCPARALAFISSPRRLSSGASHSPSNTVAMAKMALNLMMMPMMFPVDRPLVLMTASSLLLDSWLSATSPPMSVASGIS